jgi:hypothetical protein
MSDCLTTFEVNQIGGFGIFIGTKKAAQNSKWLKKNNIKGVLDVGTENKIAFPNIRYSKFMILDINEAPIEKFFDCGIDFIDLVRKDGNVLVFCESAKSLSTSIVAAWLIKKFKLSLVAAMALIRKFHPIACPNTNFADKLNEFSNQNI